MLFARRATPGTGATPSRLSRQLRARALGFAFFQGSVVEGLGLWGYRVIGFTVTGLWGDRV